MEHEGGANAQVALLLAFKTNWMTTIRCLLIE